MKLPIYQVDAFTSELFGGNPAAVCPLMAWPKDEDLLQKIAAENNLSETAFFVKEADGWRLRWFTPTAEVELCGHATLAASYVLMKLLQPELDEVCFNSLSGVLRVHREEDRFTLDFPANVGERVAAPQALLDGLDREPLEVYRSNMFYVAVFESEADVASCTPHMSPFLDLDRHGVVITAPGSEADFVSRFFGPKVGVPEDPVTGSAHTTLTPYWADRLKKDSLEAIQLSKRKGHLSCRLQGDRVFLTGRGVLYMKGEIIVPGCDWRML